MISAETPALFAKACELFIMELTLRAWEHTEESKRKTLQRSDISAAISKTDTYDFLIDIVPREDSKPPKAESSAPSSSSSLNLPAASSNSEFHQYYFPHPPHGQPMLAPPAPPPHFPPGHIPLQVRCLLSLLFLSSFFLIFFFSERFAVSVRVSVSAAADAAADAAGLSRSICQADAARSVVVPSSSHPARPIPSR
jgi:hypothetical protein